METEPFAPRASQIPLGKLRSLGDYELIVELARGGMGIVFKARQASLNRMVAVKLISAGALATPELVKRFRAEAEAAASLTHPHIVPIYEISEHEGQHYFSMGLVDGPNLSVHLARRPMANPRSAAQLVCTLARAVHFAHQRGILHRDIKPGNVVLDPEGQPHLTDFGLAKAVHGDSTLTRTDAVLGTPAYMSPEQARGDTKNVTTAVDVYGLGTVLYEALTGSPPFAGGTSFETIRQVLEQEARRPSLWNPNIDSDLETICLKCLEKDPATRYPSAQHLAQDLEHWLRHEPIIARPSTTWEHLQKWVRRRPAMSALSAGLVLALLVGGIGVTLEWRQAVAHRLRADMNAASLRQHLYRSQTALAWQTWAEGDAQHTRELLQDAAGQGRELRGFEWRYLWGLSRPQELLICTNAGPSAKYSPDGRTLVLANYFTGEAKLWDPVSHKIQKVINAYTSSCWSAVFSPNGKMLATCSRAEPDFKVWDVETGAQLARLPSRTQENFCIVFMPDGKRAATLASTGYQHIPAEVSIWDLRSQKRLLSMPGLTSWSKRIDFSLDGQTLALGDGRGFVRLWNLATGTISVLSGHRGVVFEVRFSPDGKLLASSDEQGTIILWDWASRNPVRILTGHQGPIYDLAFSRDARLLGSAGRDHTARLWNVQTGEEVGRLLGHSDRVWSVDFSFDGDTLVSQGEDQTMRFWKTTSQGASEILSTTCRGNSIGYSPDGRLLFVDEWEANRATLWDVSTRGIGLRLPGTDLTYSPDGKVLAVIQKTNLAIYETATMRLTGTIPVPPPLTGGMAISPDGKLIAARSKGRPVIMDLQKRRAISSLRSDPTGPEDLAEAYLMAFSHDSRTLITAGAPNGMINFWDALTGRKVCSLHGDQAPVRALALSPNGLVLASASEKTIRLWDLAKQAPLPRSLLRGNTGNVIALAISPDGKTLAAGSSEGPIKLWCISEGQEIGSLKAHLSTITGLAFSPDGRTLASTSIDETVRLWEAPGFEEIEANQ